MPGAVARLHSTSSSSPRWHRSCWRLGVGRTATAAAAATQPCADTRLKATRDRDLDRMRAATLCLLNAERAKHGLPALQVNDRLNERRGRTTARRWSAGASSATSARRAARSRAVCVPPGSTSTSPVRRLLSRREHRLGHRLARHPSRDSAGMDEIPGHRAHPGPPLPRYRHRHRTRSAAEASAGPPPTRPTSATGHA